MRSIDHSRLLRTPADVGKRRDDAGDTLVEVLVALVIISLCVVALLGVLTTSVTSSAEYRSLATVDTVLKNFADAVKYEVELQPATTSLYAPCAATYQVVSEYPTSTVVGAGLSIFGTDFTRNDPLTVKIGPDAPIPAGMSDDEGSVAATISLPPTPAGSWPVILSDSGSSVQSATMFTVTPSLGALVPASGPGGTSVTVPASGFLANTALSVQVGGAAATITSGGTTDQHGSAIVNFTVPLSAPPGTDSVLISDGTNSSTLSFSVGSSVGAPGPTVVPPTSAVTGTTVQITSIAYWNSSTAAFDPACGVNDNSGIQMITLQAIGPNRVSDTLQVVVTDPRFAAVPGPSVVVTSTTTSPLPGQPITFTATLTPGSPPACNAVCYPTGSVGWTIGGTGVPPQPCGTPTPVTPTGSGNTSAAMCTIPGPQVSAGTYQVAANYSGDSDYGPTSGTGSIVVAQATPVITVTATPSSPVVGEPVVFTATVSGPNGATPPTGSVFWAFDPSSPGNPSCAPNPSLLSGSPPTATCQVTSTTQGTYDVTATYFGDINYPSTSASTLATAYTVTLTSVTLNNGTGNTPGKIETGDSIVVTFSAPVDLGTICSPWTGHITNESVGDGVVTVVHGRGARPDLITIASASCSPNNGFGSINLESGAYVTGGDAALTASSISWNATFNTLTITLGVRTKPPNGTLGIVSGTTPVYTAGFLLPGSPHTIPAGPNGFQF